MANPLNPEEQKRRITETFNLMASDYDSLGFTQRCAKRLLELSNLQPGQKVLDVATGTGLVATLAAQIVGREGKVVGIDLSAQMLAQARAKSTGKTQLEFQEGDAEKLDFPDESFDVVLCASSLFFVPDMLQAVKETYRVLKPNGRFGFSSFGPTFFKPLRMLWRDRLVAHGLSLSSSLPSDRLAEPATCEALLRDAGFREIKILNEQLGYHQTLQERWHEIKVSLEGMPLAMFSENEQAQIKREHLAELEPLLTEQGLWVDVAANFALGTKDKP